MEWLFVTALWAAPLPVYDGDFACTDPKKAESYIRDFNIDVASFGGLELCKPERDTKRLFNDLEIIEEGQIGSTPTHPFIRNFVPKERYFSWLKEQTYGIERGNDMPYAIAYNSGGYFTMQDGWAKMSTLGRVGTIIHEARHTEGHYHTRCTHGPYEGSWVSGCDTSISQGGSHGVEMEYYARVYLAGENFHPVYKSMARLMLLGRANFVFNQDILSDKDQLLVRTQDGLIQFSEGARKQTPWLSPLPPSAAMKRTSFGAAVLNGQGSAWAVYLNEQNQAGLLEDEYSYYKLLQMEPPANVSDLEEVDIGNRRYMLALTRDGSLYSYQFGEGEWSPPRQLQGAHRFATVSPEGEQGAFVLFVNSTYCALDVSNLTCAGPTKLWPEKAKAFLVYQGSLLRLDETGLLKHTDGSPFPGLDGLSALDALRIPLYDVFDEP